MLNFKLRARLAMVLICGGVILAIVLLRDEAGPAADRAATSAETSSAWSTVAPGLELGHFRATVAPVVGDGIITVLRVDPAVWDLKLLSSSELGALTNRSVHRWCRDHKLVAAINAGMFATDHRTHVGYMRNASHVNNEVANSYQSVAAFGPLKDGLPAFRIFDLDEDDLADIIADYRSVIQNLRLIKRPGLNRWEPQERHWSEAALGEDREGRPLFIFTRSAFSMHDLNEVLLELPVELVCAQHLEGGPEAQFSLHVGDISLDLVGSFETNFMESDTNTLAWPVPNVIGLVEKEPAHSPGQTAGQASEEADGQSGIRN
jgi:hypothetical protein